MSAEQRDRELRRADTCAQEKEDQHDVEHHQRRMPHAGGELRESRTESVSRRQTVMRLRIQIAMRTMRSRARAKLEREVELQAVREERGRARGAGAATMSSTSVWASDVSRCRFHARSWAGCRPADARVIQCDVGCAIRQFASRLSGAQRGGSSGCFSSHSSHGCGFRG